MSNTYYRVYLRDVFRLAKTMVIKSTLAAEMINEDLESIGYNVSYDPHEWKYYKHLAGEYHATDQMMTVSSMDTLQTINFTKQNMVIHRATARSYQFNTRWYRDLVNRYPDQEMLILGILHPIDQTTAIDAPDGQILYYDHNLVEPQEHELINRIQQWIDAFLRRWSVDAYKITDELYPAAKLGVLYTHLPLEIMNIRQMFNKTMQAHSYHIREYLASHNRLDRFIEDLTLNQKLFLYRNIRYIQRNPGHQSTFDLLLQRIINEVDLPMAAYEMNHDNELLLESDPMLSQINMHLRALNDNKSDRLSNNRSLNELIDRQRPLAPGNALIDQDEIEGMRRQLQHSRFSQLPTKSLESSVLDSSDSTPVLLEKSLLFHWPYLTELGYYQAAVNVVNPTNSQAVRLDMEEAFLAYIYAFNRARGIDLATIPPFAPIHVQRDPLPSFSQLRSIVTTDEVSDQQILDLLDSMPTLEVMISNEAFFEYVQRVNKIQNRQRDWYMSVPGATQRAMLEALVMHLYQIYPITTHEGENFIDYLNAINLPLQTLTLPDNETIANQILGQATQINTIKDSKLERRQRNALQIMSELSSYSVHYVQNINADAYWILDHVGVRFDPQQLNSEEFQYYDIRQLDVIYLNQRTQDLFEIRYDPVFPNVINATQDYLTTRHPVSMQVDFTVINDIKSRFQIGLGHVDIIEMNEEDFSRLYAATPEVITPSDGSLVDVVVTLEATAHQPILDLSGRDYRIWQITPISDPHFTNPEIEFHYNRNGIDFHVEGDVPVQLEELVQDHIGINQGAITTTIGDKTGLLFSQNSDLIRISDHSDFHFDEQSSFTVSITTQPTNPVGISDFDAIVEKMSGPNSTLGWHIGQTTNGDIRALISSDDGITLESSEAFIDSTNLPTQPFTVHMVVDRQLQQMQLYMNDALQQTTDISAVMSLVNTEHLFVGLSHTFESYRGWVSDLVIWGHAVTQQEITDYQQQGITDHHPAMIGYWPLALGGLTPDTSYQWRCRDLTNEGHYTFWMPVQQLSVLA